MRKSKVDYQCSENFERLVISAAKQLFDARYTPPANRDDSNMYREHPKFWPIPERSLRRPSGKRGKGFDGLTYDMREWLKRLIVEGPPEIKLGLKVLAWWHREIWQTGLGQADHRTYTEYMRHLLATDERLLTDLSVRERAVFRKLYDVGSEKAAA